MRAHARGMPMRLGLLLLFVLLATSSTFSDTEEGIRRDASPNILFILTDDQDLVLAGLDPMPNVRELVQKRGTTFSNWFASTPICCPSRAGMLTGRYAHNIRDSHFVDSFDCDVANSTCGCMRMNTSGDFESHTFAPRLKRGGYTTAYFGKYLNPPGMAPLCNLSSPLNAVPPGWDHFYAMCNTDYYNVNWTLNGKIQFTGNQVRNYTTSLIGNRTVDFIRSNKGSASPWYAMQGPCTPARWYLNYTVPRKNPHLPNYDYHANDHLPYIAAEPPLTSVGAHGLNEDYANRWRTLLSVDDLVKGAIDALEETGQLDNTFIMFTSDHGYHLGEFRLPQGKTHPYDFDIRVPMVVRGPGVAEGKTLPLLAGHVDLAPTFLSLAGVPYEEMDGRSVSGHLLGTQHAGLTRRGEATSQTLLSSLERSLAPGSRENSWRTAFLLEYYAVRDWPSGWHMGEAVNDGPNNTYRALRILDGNHDLLYVEYTVVSDWFFENINFFGLFDIAKDPYQLSNGYNDVSKEERLLLHSVLEREWHCKGESCK